MIEKPVEVQFADERIRDTFEKLADPNLKKSLKRAFTDIMINPFCGIQIPKKQIPKEYLRKFNIHNAWKYNLPNAWRMIYSIKGGDAIILTIILEWLDHKQYERRFNY
jgi:hypothetical protein